MDFIGFKVLDSMGNGISQFLTLSMKAHDVSFIHHLKKGKLHHGPFVLDTWDNALLAANRISMTIGRTAMACPTARSSPGPPTSWTRRFSTMPASSTSASSPR